LLRHARGDRTPGIGYFCTGPQPGPRSCNDRHGLRRVRLPRERSTCRTRTASRCSRQCPDRTDGASALASARRRVEGRRGDGPGWTDSRVSPTTGKRIEGQRALSPPRGLWTGEQAWLAPPEPARHRRAPALGRRPAPVGPRCSTPGNSLTSGSGTVLALTGSGRPAAVPASALQCRKLSAGRSGLSWPPRRYCRPGTQRPVD
jgi:hypothetical protein